MNDSKFINLMKPGQWNTQNTRDFQREKDS